MASANASRYVYEPGQPFYTHSVFYLQRLRCAPQSRTSLEENQGGSVGGRYLKPLVTRVQLSDR